MRMGTRVQSAGCKARAGQRTRSTVVHDRGALREQPVVRHVLAPQHQHPLGHLHPVGRAQAAPACAARQQRQVWDAARGSMWLFLRAPGSSAAACRWQSELPTRRLACHVATI